MSKDYGQFCGLAKASSVLGERWSLLIVRDLSVAPRRFKDLHEGLPGIPTSLLTTRLRELQAHGIVIRVADEQPGGGVQYQLTPRGRELEPILDALGRWGAATMTTPEPTDVITGASLAAALRAGFQRGVEPAETVYVVHAGPATAWARATNETVMVAPGTPDVDPELAIHSGPELRAVIAGELTPSDALNDGTIRIDGPPELFERFVRTFHVPLSESATPE